jgi:hypothetical protein
MQGEITASGRVARDSDTDTHPSGSETPCARADAAAESTIVNEAMSAGAPVRSR